MAVRDTGSILSGSSYTNDSKGHRKHPGPPKPMSARDTGSILSRSSNINGGHKKAAATRTPWFHSHFLWLREIFSEVAGKGFEEGWI